MWIVYLKNLKNELEPWPQLWYGLPTDGKGQIVGHDRILQKYEIKETDKRMHFSMLMRLYPYKPPE